MVMRFVLKQRSRRCQKGYCLQRGVAQNSLPRNIRRREREELGQCRNEAYDNVVSKEAGAIVRGEVLNDQTRKRDGNLLRCDAQSEGTVSASSCPATHANDSNVNWVIAKGQCTSASAEVDTRQSYEPSLRIFL